MEMGQHHSRRRTGGLRKGGLLYTGLSADLSDKGTAAEIGMNQECAL